jgi:hypothetical protein
MTRPALTIFTSEQPTALGKTYSLSKDGTLTKTTAGQMTRGTYQVRSFDTVHDLAAILASLSTAQALSSSLPTPGKAEGVVLTEKAVAAGGADVDAVARTKRHFSLPAGQPGVMLIDVDAPPSGDPPARDDLFSLLTSICPGLAQAGVLWSPSGSSCLYEGDTLRRGIKGQHLYVMVSDLADVPRFGKLLDKRLWLASHGRIDVSASGALLPRTVADQSVNQPGRLIFSAGAVCTPPLEQRRGRPLVLADGPPLDTLKALPDLSAEDEGRFVALLETAKVQAEARAAEARAAWRAEREREGLKQAIDDGRDPQQARELIGRTLDAALGGSLLGSFPLVIVDDNGKESATTVDAILKVRDRYHLGRVLDPLNPDHRGRTADAILYLNQPVPVVYSLDDGGTIYRLMRQPTRLAVVNGERARLAELIANELAQHDDLFMLGGQPVRLANGNTTAVTRPLLAYLIGCRIALYRQGKDKQSPTEPDAQLLDVVAVLLNDKLRKIIARSTIPLIDPTGRVIDRPGFDAPSGIYLDMLPGQFEAVTHAPTREQCIEALRRAWAPWSAYQWSDADSRAAMLSAILTLPLRPTIDAAPGLFADSPVQSSGKSKAVGALAAIARGFKGGAKTWPNNDETELLKWALSTSRSGDPAAVLDNVVGVMRSPALAVAMAEGKVSDRLLGVSQILSLDARITWLASGNNASLDRDMATRWLIARIDTGAENPSVLAYSFDPVDRALSDRLGIVRAVITLHRAWHTVGCPRADSINTRFSDWGRTVRQLVLWLRDSDIAKESGIGLVGDPARSILEGSAANDPETEAVMQAWHALGELFPGAKPFTSAAVKLIYDAAEAGGDDDAVALRESFEVWVGARGKPSTRVFHTALNNRRDRIAAGLKLEAVPQYGPGKLAVWRIVPVPHRQGSNQVQETAAA